MENKSVIARPQNVVQVSPHTGNYEGEHAGACGVTLCPDLSTVCTHSVVVHYISVHVLAHRIVHKTKFYKKYEKMLCFIK